MYDHNPVIVIEYHTIQYDSQVSMAEWLRRQTRNLLGFPAQVQILLLTFFCILKWLFHLVWFFCVIFGELFLVLMEEQKIVYLRFII